MNWCAAVEAMKLSSRQLARTPVARTPVARTPVARTPVAGLVFAILSVPVVGNRAMAEGTATQEQPRKLEKAERIEVVRGGGYFPTLIRLTDGTLAAVVRGGARHIGVGGRLDLVTSRDGGRH